MCYVLTIQITSVTVPYVVCVEICLECRANNEFLFETLGGNKEACNRKINRKTEPKKPNECIPLSPFSQLTSSVANETGWTFPNLKYNFYVFLHIEQQTVLYLKAICDLLGWAFQRSFSQTRSAVVCLS